MKTVTSRSMNRARAILDWYLNGNFSFEKWEPLMIRIAHEIDDAVRDADRAAYKRGAKGCAEKALAILARGFEQRDDHRARRNDHERTRLQAPEVDPLSTGREYRSGVNRPILEWNHRFDTEREDRR